MKNKQSTESQAPQIFKLYNIVYQFFFKKNLLDLKNKKYLINYMNWRYP